jgi:hypothetical protein
MNLSFLEIILPINPGLATVILGGILLKPDA